MKRRSLLTIFLGLLCVLLLIVLTAGGAYYMGLKRQEQNVQLLRGEQAVREHEYAKGLNEVSAERDQAASDYQTVCFEYQKLRQAYEKNVSSAAANQYVFPGEASGRGMSCYR